MWSSGGVNHRWCSFIGGHPEVLYEKGVLKNLAKFRGKQLGVSF